MNRTDFLNSIVKRPPAKATYNTANDPLVKKYGNKSLPLDVKRTRSGLAPYTGTWGEKQQLHLLKRTMFGVTKNDLNALQSLTMSQSVDLLVNATPTIPSPPVNYYENIQPDTQSVPFGQTWVNTPYDTVGTVSYYRYLSTQAWWMNNIIQQPTSIEEKMVLFWHNHFATQWSAVGENRVYYNHLKLIRSFALGNFKSFVKAMTKDAMMLIFLNGYYNNKYAPDENYARELQELFTIGKDPSYYTEDDVKAAARVLTGYRLDLALSTNYFFDDTWHDETNKQFSTFYNNTVITGQTGANGENELDDLLNMIFSKSTIVSKFICRKLYRYFIHYDIDASTEANVITGLAQTFVASNWDIKPVLLQLFKSEHFYDTVMSTDCLIQNPMDYYLGFARTTKVDFPTITQLEDFYQAKITMFYICDLFAMTPGNPPNVAGWPAYYQTPQFHQMWVNSDTISNRIEFTDYLLTDYGLWVTSMLQIRSNVISFAMDCSNPGDPNVLLDYITDRLMSFTLSTASKAYHKSILLSGQAQDYYWTNAWSNYITNPTNTIYEGIVRSRLQQLLTQLCRMAEHQIS